MRSAIRSRAISRIRDYDHDEIMQAQSYEQLLFNKLIRDQRSTKSTNTDTPTIDGSTMVGDEQVLHGFANYFEDLTTPNDTCSDDYDEDYIQDDSGTYRYSNRGDKVIFSSGASFQPIDFLNVIRSKL